jgi:glycosyltransferase involved in cell wall biosynthesis
VRLLFLNRFPFHESFAARLVDAAVGLGHDVVYLGRGELDVSSAPVTMQRIRVNVPRWRYGIVPPVRAYYLDIQDRWKVWRLDARFKAREIDKVVDLHAARTLWALGPSSQQPRARIIHRSDAFDLDLKGSPPPVVFARRARFAQVVKGGDVAVVHTSRARHVLQQFLPEDRILLVPHPGPFLDEPWAHLAKPAGRFRLLWVGDTRHEKGYDILVHALERVSDDQFELVRVGSAADRIRGSNSVQSDSRVGRVTVSSDGRQIADAELRDAYRSADVVVCPYRSTYAASGSASSVVSEALAFGVPLVASASLGPLLPSDFRGWVSFADEDVRGLTDALRAAREQRAALYAAAADGPRYTAAHANPLLYMRTVLDSI